MPEDLKYTEITIRTHLDAVEGLSDLLLSLGAKGIAEERRPFDIRLTAYLIVHENVPNPTNAIRTRLKALEQQGLRIGHGTIGLRTVASTAWSEAWKDQFTSQQIAPGLVIAPSWEERKPLPGECVVVLDPGAAFGTGGHATTRLCLRSLIDVMRPGDRVADIGTGSGILAIAAALLGAREVVAADNDASALPVARRNAERNKVADQIKIIEADLLPADRGPFDVILCNIVAEEIVRLSEHLFPLLSWGGRFIGSGYIAAAVPMVEDALARAHLQLLDTRSEEGWAASIAVKPARKA
jgi:ribosomal protein L11 methyltransferase